MRRKTVCVLVATFGLGLLGAIPAMARAQEEIVVSRGKKVEKNYSALVGNPGTQVIVTAQTPANCAMPVTYCDVIPLRIIVPANLKSNEDFFVKTTLSWDPQTVSGNNTNDLNLFLYDKGGTAAIARSSGIKVPEVVTLFRPDKGEYVILIGNHQGANTGYKITVELTTEELVSPFESIDLGGGQGFGSPSSDGGFSVGSGDAIGGGFSSGPSSDFALSLANVDSDSDLSSLSQLRGNIALDTPPQTFVNPVRERKDKPVSGLLLALWTVVVPAGLLAGGVFWLRSRGSGAIKLG